MILTVRRPGNKTTSNLVTVQVHKMILTVRRPGNKTTSNLVTVQVHTMILTVRRPGNKTTSNLRDCTGTYNDINSEEAWEQDYL